MAVYLGILCRVSRVTSPMDFTSTFLKLIDVNEVRVWRVSRRVRILCALMGFVMFALTAYVAISAAADLRSPAGVALAFFVVGDFIVFRVLRYAFGAVTTAAPDGLVIGTGRLIGRKRRRVLVPWQVIDSCEPRDSGTSITCSDGRRVLAAMPQRPNVSGGQHRKTEADYFALYVMERARLARELSA